MNRVIGVLPVLLLATACGILAGPSAPALPDAPAEVANRSRLPFCGQESTFNDGDFNLDARRCFWEAYLAGRPAEFITTQPTIEGDPLTFVYRVLGEGQVEVFVDQTYDMAGPNPPSNWIRLDCRTLAIIDGAQGQPAFGPSDCDEYNSATPRTAIASYADSSTFYQGSTGKFTDPIVDLFYVNERNSGNVVW